MSHVTVIPSNSLPARVIQRHLSRLGYDVVEAGWHAAAPESEDGPEAVILDLTAIRGTPQHFLATHVADRTHPAIALLRQDQELSVEDALAYGVQAILHEPLRLQELELALTTATGAQMESRRLMSNR